MFPWHRFFHTYLGAALVGVFSVVVGRPICQLALRIWRSWQAAPFKRFFPTATEIPMTSAISGAFIGTFSHVFLDSLMHSDTTPFEPFSTANPFYHAVSNTTIHLSCVALGLTGVFYLARMNRRRTIANRPPVRGA